MRKTLLIAFAILFCLPFIFNKDVNPTLAYNRQEKFNPRLSFINSINRLESYTDSIAATKNISAGSYEYAELLESVISDRFYHGFSHFTVRENWIAALAGKLLKEDYACLVEPEKIMQHPNAACSQQAMVMMAVLRKKKMSYRSLGFPHHYAMCVLIKDEWCFFDANMEPSINKENRRLTNWQHHNDYLKKFYDHNRFANLDYQFGKSQVAIVGVINEEPAKNARIFDSVTGALSKIAWCFPLLLLFFFPRFKATLPFVSFQLQRTKPSLSFSA
jgi:hypothetical protein